MRPQFAAAAVALFAASVAADDGLDFSNFSPSAAQACLTAAASQQQCPGGSSSTMYDDCSCTSSFMTTAAGCLNQSDDFVTWSDKQFKSMASDTYDNFSAGCEAHDYDVGVSKNKFLTIATGEPVKQSTAAKSSATTQKSSSSSTSKATSTASTTGAKTSSKTTSTTATSSATNTGSSDSNKSQGGLSTTAKVAIGVVGGLAGLVLISVLIFFLKHRATHKENAMTALQSKPYGPIDDYHHGPFGGSSGGNGVSAASPFIRNSGYGQNTAYAPQTVSPDSRYNQAYASPPPQQQRFSDGQPQQFGQPQAYQQHLSAGAVPVWQNQANAAQNSRYEPYSSGRAVSPAVTPPPPTGPQTTSTVFEMDSSAGGQYPAHAQMPHIPPTSSAQAASLVSPPIVSPDSGYHPSSLMPAGTVSPRQSGGHSY